MIAGWLIFTLMFFGLKSLILHLWLPARGTALKALFD
jgi:hypothetical protein